MVKLEQNNAGSCKREGKNRIKDKRRNANCIYNERGIRKAIVDINLIPMD